MKKLIVSLALTAASFIGNTQAATNLLLNGDFEAPATLNGFGYQYATPANWSSAGGVPVIFGAAYFNPPVSSSFVPPFDTQAVQLELAGSSISQSVSLAAGDYQLSFDLARWQAPNPGVLGIGLTNATTSDPLSYTANNTGWQHFSLNFSTSGGSTVLTLTNAGPTGGPYPYAQIDNVVISAVPEASEVAMMLTGLGVLGLMVRRRKLLAR